jgi:hypothetical protein
MFTDKVSTDMEIDGVFTDKPKRASKKAVEKLSTPSSTPSSPSGKPMKFTDKVSNEEIDELADAVSSVEIAPKPAPKKRAKTPTLPKPNFDFNYPIDEYKVVLAELKSLHESGEVEGLELYIQDMENGFKLVMESERANAKNEAKKAFKLFEEALEIMADGTDAVTDSEILDPVTDEARKTMNRRTNEIYKQLAALAGEKIDM